MILIVLFFSAVFTCDRGDWRGLTLYMLVIFSVKMSIGNIPKMMKAVSHETVRKAEHTLRAVLIKTALHAVNAFWQVSIYAAWPG